MTTARPRIVPLATLACLAVLPAIGRAAIYTWTDANGVVNVSNLAPPDDARGVRVAPDLTAGGARPVPAPQAPVDVLAERVRELEAELQAARRATPAPAVAMIPAPPVATPVVLQTIVVQAAAPAEPPGYDMAAACSTGWAGCSGFWGTPFAAPFVVVQGSAPPSRRVPHDNPRPGPSPALHTGGAPWAMIRPLMP